MKFRWFQWSFSSMPRQRTGIWWARHIVARSRYVGNGRSFFINKPPGWNSVKRLTKHALWAVVALLSAWHGGLVVWVLGSFAFSCRRTLRFRSNYSDIFSGKLRRVRITLCLFGTRRAPQWWVLFRADNTDCGDDITDNDDSTAQPGL
jgi:hypothetical protein